MNHKACYGTMFPETLTIPRDRPLQGKAFSLLVQRAGGLFVANRSASVDMTQWDDCCACGEFDHCYRLCVARLLLEAAVAGG